MKDKKKYALIAILLLITFSFVYYHNTITNIVMNCYLEIEKEHYEKGLNINPKQYYSININIQARDSSKYKSIKVDYPTVDNYDKLSTNIVSISEDETDITSNTMYEKNIKITFDPKGLDYERIKESLNNQFVNVKLESMNGKITIKKYSIGGLLKDKTTL